MKTAGTGATTPVARFAMPGAMTVSVQGPDMSVQTAIEVLQETVKHLRKGLSQGLSLASLMKCMRDTARPKA